MRDFNLLFIKLLMNLLIQSNFVQILNRVEINFQQHYGSTVSVVLS